MAAKVRRTADPAQSLPASAAIPKESNMTATKAHNTTRNRMTRPRILGVLSLSESTGESYVAPDSE